MENASVWQVFSQLSHLERKHLGAWLQSPLFNKRSAPLVLFDYFQECLALKKVPERQVAIEKLGQVRTKGDKPAFSKADDQALRLVMSELLEQIERFLAYKESLGHEGNYHLVLATAFRKRGLEKPFFQNLHKAAEIWEKQPFRHTEYHDAKADIAYEQYQLLSTGRRTIPLNLQEVSDNTDTAFIARKLREACFALSHEAVFQTQYNLGLLPSVLQYLQTTEHLLALPAVALYYYCYLFLKEPDQDHYFQAFKLAFYEKMDRLPEDEQRNLYLLALNYCIKKINQRKQAYIRETFNLYQAALKNNLLLENGVLSPFAFNNIVAAAIMAGETTWAATFITEYTERLEKKHREPIASLNFARVSYYQGDHGKALLYLQQADYKDLINNLIAKTIQLKIYYELDELEVLEAHLENMRIYIRRQRVIGFHKTNYLNIVKYARKLMRVNSNSKTEKAVLRQLIENESYLTEKDWFLAQIR